MIRQRKEKTLGGWQSTCARRDRIPCFGRPMLSFALARDKYREIFCENNFFPSELVQLFFFLFLFFRFFPFFEKNSGDLFLGKL